MLRNIGGRMTPELLEELGLLRRIGEVAGEIPGGGGKFQFVVLQLTDCGVTRLTGDPAKLAHYFQIQGGELKTKAVTGGGRPRRCCAPGDSRIAGREVVFDIWQTRLRDIWSR